LIKSSKWKLNTTHSVHIQVHIQANQKNFVQENAWLCGTTGHVQVWWSSLELFIFADPAYGVSSRVTSVLRWKSFSIMIGQICYLPSNKFTKEGWKQQEYKINDDKSIEWEANVIFPASLDVLQTDKENSYNKNNTYLTTVHQLK